MTKPSFKLGLVQMSMSASPDDNLAKAVERVREAAGKGAEVVCLPEMFRTPYFCQKEDHANFALAETVPGPSTEALGRAAKQAGVAVVVPIFERRAPGVYHNSAVILDADGSVAGLYRKMHIPDDPLFYEKFYFAPGDLGFQAFDVKPGRIGTLICWDQWYPEGARLTALRGAAVLFYPTAIGWHPSEKAEHGVAQRSAWQTIQRSHAIANGVYVAVVNRVGHERPRRRRRPRVLGLELPRRPVRRRGGRGLDRQGGDPGGRGEPAAHRRGAHALAVPARPPHRRLRRNRAALHRPRVVVWRAPPSSPAPQSFRMPAEWEAARGDLARLAAQPVRLARALRADPVGLRRDRAEARRGRAGADPGALARARARRRARILERVGAATERVEFFRFPSDRGWTRDFGPICVRREQPKPEVAVARFRFSGWAKYPDHRKDDQIAERAAKALRLRAAAGASTRGARSCSRAAPSTWTARARCSRPRSACSIPSCRCATPASSAPTTSRCSPRELGARRTRLARQGHRGGRHPRPRRRPLPLRRTATTIVLCREQDPKDANYRALEENRERLQDARLADGREAEVVDLPMPAPLVFDGRRLPASYANFYIANAAVLVPTFNDPNDRVALGDPGRAVPGPARGRHPRGRAGVGPRHAPLPDAAGDQRGVRGVLKPPDSQSRPSLAVVASAQGRIVKYSAPPHARLSPWSRGSTRQTPYIDVSVIEDPATASVASRVASRAASMRARGRSVARTFAASRAAPGSAARAGCRRRRAAWAPLPPRRAPGARSCPRSRLTARCSLRRAARRAAGRARRRPKRPPSRSGGLERPVRRQVRRARAHPWMRPARGRAAAWTSTRLLS